MSNEIPITEIPVAIVGYGKIARDCHEPAIAENAALGLVAIADPASRHDRLSSYSDLGSMLEQQPEIAAVSICTPPSVRAQVAAFALTSGRHCLLEKPPCKSVADAEELVELARSADVTLFASWHSQFGAAVSTVRAWLAGRHVKAVRVSWKEDVQIWHPGQDWIWREGGFGVFDPGINALSILTAILKEPLQVTSSTLAVSEEHLMPIAAQLELEGESGLQVAAEFNFRQKGKQVWDIKLETDSGTAVLSKGGNALSIDGRNVALPLVSEYRAIYERFYELIRLGRSAVDLAPLVLVEQAISIGNRISAETFELHSGRLGRSW